MHTGSRTTWAGWGKAGGYRRATVEVRMGRHRVLTVLMGAVILGAPLGVTGVAAAEPASGSEQAQRPRAAGPDFNGDGYADLAIGVPHEDLSGLADAGVVNIIYGSATGLNSTAYQWFDEHAACAACVDEQGNSFGSALAAGR